MAITTMDGIVSALGASKDQKLYFQSATNVAGGFINLNQAVAGSFGLLAAPAAYGSGGTTYDQTINTPGYPKWSATTEGKTTYIGRVGATFTTAGTLHIYDLLWCAGGFVGNSTAVQSVVDFSGLPTRGGTGVGNEIWIGCTTAIGATAHNVTVQYTNSDGVSGRSTVSTAGITSMPANRMYQVGLQSGDVGVQSIQSLTLSASSGTAGNLRVYVMDRICACSAVMPNIDVVSDFASLGLPVISDSACLLFIHQGTATSSGIIMGHISIIQG